MRMLFTAREGPDNEASREGGGGKMVKMPENLGKPWSIPQS